MNFNDNVEELPLGLSLALAQDLNALDHFASLNDEKQQKVINKAKQIKSKEEMHAYVQDIKNFWKTLDKFLLPPYNCHIVYC